jgi:hypothetical protein
MVVLLTKLANIHDLMRVAEVQDTFMATIYQRGGVRPCRGPFQMDASSHKPQHRDRRRVEAAIGAPEKMLKLRTRASARSMLAVFSSAPSVLNQPRSEGY